MTARTAGARDDELDRSGTPRRCLHRWLRPLDGGLPTGTAMSSTNEVLTFPSTAPPSQHGTTPPRHHTHRGALNDDELTRRLRDFKPSRAL
jgi:hypothetical protein